MNHQRNLKNLTEYPGNKLKSHFTIKTYVFEAEGILRKEKLLSDGNYYNTVVMGRFHD
ncbi:hypothetical protein B4070_0693 [Bacillus subtilis]|nr:hypothetical protein B4070_0693 [Bacillus subtilis]